MAADPTTGPATGDPITTVPRWISEPDVTSTRTTVPGPADGLLPVPVVRDLIRVVNTPDHEAWMAQVRRIGGCAHPLHMAGRTRRIDVTTGQVLGEFTSANRPGGVVLVPCRNRREIACPACARVYHGDTFHLVRAGLLGGKGVPETVTAHPRIFLTLTAPGFGPVHTIRTPATGSSTRTAPCTPRRTAPCPHGAPTSCWARHDEDDPVLGAPLCPDCYDYPGAVVWQASMGALWQRFVIYLPRHLARIAGMTQKALRAQVRLSYVKIVEFQRRGLVHVHAVIRADAAPEPGTVTGTTAPVRIPPAWVTAALLERAARSAATAVHVTITADGVGRWDLAWGEQLDVQDVTGTDGSDEPTGRRIALYIAKYATKSTEITGWNPSTGTESTPRGAHAERMVRTALTLAPHPDLEDLKLGRWARHLAFRGHVSSKSRRYSTTLAALRTARAEYQRSVRRPLGDDDGDGDAVGVRVESAWRLVGHGYSPGQALLAADVARDIALNRVAAREAATEAPE